MYILVKGSENNKKNYKSSKLGLLEILPQNPLGSSQLIFWQPSIFANIIPFPLDKELAAALPARVVLEEVPYYILLDVFNSNVFKVCDSISTRKNSAKQTHIEYGWIWKKTAQQVKSVSDITNLGCNNKDTHKALPEIVANQSTGVGCVQ